MTDADARTTSSRPDPVREARDAYRRRQWVAARHAFRLVHDRDGLGPDDLYALSNCAWWLGDLDEALPLQQQAYQAFLDVEEPASAALVAIDVGYTLMIRGEAAQGTGWIGRAVRLLDDRPDCVEFGFLVFLRFERAFGASDLDEAFEAAHEVHALGRMHGDATLTALGVLGQGRVLVRRGEVEPGMALLDEAMLAAVSDDLDPAWAGNIYCHLMVACYEIADLRRASEWTEVTSRWCHSMPGAGPFLGICRLHRAQVLQVRGAWDDAEREAVHVVGTLQHVDTDVVAEAHYLIGELRRARGDLDGAEDAYREAHRLGRVPQPGLALLRLVSGDVEAAATSIRSALTSTEGDPSARARLLPAAIEVTLARGDREQARAWSSELTAAADTYGTTGFAAAALQARGAVLLAGHEARDAIPVLQEALRATRTHEAPYEVARVRLLLAAAYDRVADHDTASLERSAAMADLARLGVTDVATPPIVGPTRRATTGVLTPREVEVLGLVADGRSNQDIAATLVLSVRTVERHLSTIYQKLGLEGRSARASPRWHRPRCRTSPPSACHSRWTTWSPRSRSEMPTNWAGSWREPVSGRSTSSRHRSLHGSPNRSGSWSAWSTPTPP
jgi:ATP/maltotriose-dependent transcriptional regulator MalT